MSTFKKHYKIVDDNFKDYKERYIINEIINQSLFQKTNKPLIEQTYLALLCGCTRMTIYRTLKRLEKDGWISHKMVLNSQGYTTTQFSINDKMKELIKSIGMEKKAMKKIKQKVINSIIPIMGDEPLSVERCNF